MVRNNFASNRLAFRHPRFAFRHPVVGPRFAFRHPLVRPRFAFASCSFIRRVWTPWGWRLRRVWVC
jgi:hypothetical protein